MWHEFTICIQCCIRDKFRDFLIIKHVEFISHLHLRLFSRGIRILCILNEKAILHKTRSQIVTRVLRGFDLSFQKNAKSNSNRNRSGVLITSVTNETSFFLRNEKGRSFGWSVGRSFVQPYLLRIDLATAWPPCLTDSLTMRDRFHICNRASAVSTSIPTVALSALKKGIE